MLVLIDTSLIIAFCKKEREHLCELREFELIIKLHKSTKFALRLCRTSINEKEVMIGRQKQFLSELANSIPEVDYGSVLGSSNLGDEYIGGENTEFEMQQYISQFTSLYTKNPPINEDKVNANKNDGIQCFLTKILDARCFLTLDRDTIINRHKEFLDTKGVIVQSPSDLVKELKDIHNDLDSLS